MKLNFNLSSLWKTQANLQEGVEQEDKATNSSTWRDRAITVAKASILVASGIVTLVSLRSIYSMLQTGFTRPQLSPSTDHLKSFNAKPLSSDHSLVSLSGFDLIGPCALKLTEAMQQPLNKLAESKQIAFSPDEKTLFKVIPDVGVIASDAASFHTNGYASVSAQAISLTRDGKLGIVASGAQGVTVMDVSDVSSLKTLGVTPNWQGIAYDITLTDDENFVIVSTDQGRKLVDISTRSNPQLVDDKKIPKQLCDALQIAIDNNEATTEASNDAYVRYLINGGHFLKGEISIHKQNAMSSDGTVAFTVSGPNGISISDFTNIQEIKTIGTTTGWVGDAKALVLVEEEKRLYVANGKQGVTVVDVSDRTKPVVLGTTKDWEGLAYDLTPLDKNLGASFKGFFEVKTIDQGTKIVDASDPTNLKFFSSEVQNPPEVTISGNIAYVTWRDENGENIMKVLDLTDPGNPLM